MLPSLDPTLFFLCTWDFVLHSGRHSGKKKKITIQLLFLLTQRLTWSRKTAKLSSFLKNSIEKSTNGKVSSNSSFSQSCKISYWRDDTFSRFFCFLIRNSIRVLFFTTGGLFLTTFVNFYEIGKKRQIQIVKTFGIKMAQILYIKNVQICGKHRIIINPERKYI